MENKMELRFPAISDNESFARTCVASFVSQLNPTLEQISDIKTAISEAVTNVVVHAYDDNLGEVLIRSELTESAIIVIVQDFGKGIMNIELAKMPFYTTANSSDRSGMGFTVMETFMDEIEVFSEVGNGTRVVMRKQIKNI